MSQQSNAVLIRLSQPVAGQVVTVPVDRDNMRMALDFTPDPNMVAKNGQDLEFTFDDGGTLVLQGYYDHFADKTLPVMVTEEGDELPGEDFLASLREDLLTAAGPGAGAGAAGGGVNDYADDPGALIDGIDRLGSLGTIYWDRATEVPEQFFGQTREAPGGSGDFSVITDLTTDPEGRIVSGVYEDARPWQHQSDPEGSEHRYGQIQFVFNGSGSTVCDFVNMSGFHEGTVIYLGDPLDPTTPTITITDENQPVRIPAGQFATGGVYLKPPTDSDGDMDISSTLEIRAQSSGHEATVPGPDFVVVVDAVADKPDLVMDGEMGTYFDAPELDGALTIGETREGQDYADGWATDSLAKNSEENSSETNAEGVTVTAKFHSAIQFGDHADSSESHYALVQVPSPGNWEPVLDSISPDGVEYTGIVTLWYDADGNLVAETAPGEDGPENATPKDFYQFDVDGALGDNGSVNLELDFTSSDTNLAEDTTFTLETGAKAVDSSSDDSELDTDNNVSYTFTEEYEDGEGEPYTPNFTVDTVDSTLEVKVGWASEDGDDSQNAEGYIPGYGAMHDQLDGKTDAGEVDGVYEKSTNAGESAPIVISIEGGDDSEGNAETITEIRLYFDPEAGDIAIDGEAQEVRVDAESGRSYVLLTPENGGIDADGQSTADSNITFVPTENDRDGDVALSYEVTVRAEPSGAEAVYTGETTVVIDAVADQPTECAITSAPDSGCAEATANETVTVTGSVAFADTDGSEAHYAVISFSDNFLPNGWSVKGVDGLAGKDALVDHWSAACEGKIPEATIASMLDGMSDSALSLLVEVTYEDGNPSVRVWAANANGELVDVTEAFPDCDGWYDEATGELNYTLQVNTPETVTDDSSVQIHGKGVTLEETPEGEYDFVNNISVNEGSDFGSHPDDPNYIDPDGPDDSDPDDDPDFPDDTTVIKLDTVTSGLYVAFNEKEDNEPDQYWKGENGSLMPDFGLPVELKLVEVERADNAETGAQKGDIIVDPTTGVPVPAEDAGDYISSLTFNSLPDAGEGVIYYNGQPVTVDNIANLPGAALDAEGNITFTNPDADGFTFKPAPDFSGDVPFDVTATISSGTSTAERENVKPQEAPGDAAHLHVDSVADEAVIDEDTAAFTPETTPDGRYEVEASDGAAEVVDGKETGWFVSEADSETPINATVTLDVAFTDTDGSEDAMLLVECIDGVTVVDPETGDPLEIETVDGKDYYVVAKGPVGENGLQSGKFPIELEISREANLQDLNVVVRTEETQPGHTNETGNDVADKNWSTQIDLAWLSKAVTVKTGWVSEDGDAGKYKESGDHLFGGPDGVDDATTNNGAPVKIDFGEAEGVTWIVFAYNPAEGELLYNGGAIMGGQFNADTGLWEVSISADNSQMLDRLTFKPNDKYSDADINLQYRVQLENEDGDKFEVKGNTTIVVDAVADLAKVEDADVDYKDDQTTHTGEGGEPVTITVDAAFPDAENGDDSERHYILVEKPGEGWTAGEDGEAYTLWVDKATGEPAQPIGVDENGNFLYDEAAAEPREYFRFDVTDETPGENGYAVEIHAPEEGFTKDETFEINTGSMVEETVKPGDADHEYDYTNNVAVDLADDTVKIEINVQDSGLKGTATDAYEDHADDVGEAPGTLDTDGVITLAVGKADADGEYVGGASGEFLDVSEDAEVVLTFSYDGDADLETEASFTILVDGVEQAAEYEIVDLGGGKYEVRFPAADFGEADSVNTVQVRYNPPADDDHDLTDITASVPVKSEGNDNAATLETGVNDLKVDAVADMPLAGSGEVTDYQNPANAGEGYTAANWGSVITVETVARFGDTDDGSESHYLVIEAKPGWSCSDAEGVIMIEGKAYFYKTADVDEDGNATGSFTLTAPDGSDDTIPDYDVISDDGTVNLATGGLAVEGVITDNEDFDGSYNPDTMSELDYAHMADGTDRDAGVTEDNNLALNTSNTAIDFNVVNDGKGSESDVFEDTNTGAGVTPGEAANDHYEAGGKPSGTFIGTGTTNGKTGIITIALTGPDDTIQGDVAITFSIKDADWTDGKPDTLGSFTLADGTPVQEGWLSYEAGPDGSVIVTIALPDPVTESETGIALHYTPPADQSADLENIEYSLTAQSTNSGAVEKVTSDGPIGSLVVDAVADRPELATDSQGVRYGDAEAPTAKAMAMPELSAAVPGAKVTLDVGEITFNDYRDGSESHSIVVQVGGIAWTNENGAKDDTGSVSIGQQTITVYSTNNAAMQVIELGENGASSTIAVYDAAGDLVLFRELSETEYNQLVTGETFDSSLDAAGTADDYAYAKIPVLNEFLQVSDGGEVTATVDVTMPKGQGSDTSYQINAGGYAEDTEPGDADTNGITDDNNFAADLGTIEVDVNVVTSGPQITAGLDGNDTIYENLTPNAHENLGEHGSEDESGHTNPDDHVHAEYNTPAHLNLTGIDEGETADVTLYFKAGEDPDGSAAPVNFEESDAHVTVGDDPTPYYLQGPNENGEYSVNLPPLDGNAVINFYPGTNYSDNDISVNYEMTVTDTASGAQKTYSSRDRENTNDATYDMPEQGITVDAVAQAPDVEVEGGIFPVGAGAIAVKGSVTFQDYQDGSELHYIMVEAQIGYTIESITIEDAAGKTWTLDYENGKATLTGPDGATYDCTPEGGVNWQYDGNQYNRFTVPDDLVEACEGDLKLTVNMDTPDKTTNTSFIIGGMSHEDPNQLDSGDTRDNNQAITIGEAAQVQFEDKGRIGVTVDKPVYEGDEPWDNKGDDSHAGGVEVRLSLPEGEQYEVTEITFDSDRGTVYEFPKGTSEAAIREAIANGTAQKAVGPYDNLPGNDTPDVGDYTFIYVADDINDTDANVTVTGRIENTNTGSVVLPTDEGGKATVDVLVDAVAQRPTIDEFIAGGEGEFSLKVTFPDDDDSENHYLLIQAKPGVPLYVNGALQDEDPDAFYYHQNADGSTTAYYKVPLAPGDEPDDGTYSVEITYDGAGDFKYGAMGDEEAILDGEQNYHNNVSVVVPEEPGHAPGDGDGEDWPSEWLEPGGHHDCHERVPDIGNSGGYENSTQDANYKDYDKNEHDGDANLSFGYIRWDHHEPSAEHPVPDDATTDDGVWCLPERAVPDEVTLTFNPEDAALLIDGEYVFESGSNANCSWTVELVDGKVTVTITGYNENPENETDGIPSVALRPGNYKPVYDGETTLDDPDFDPANNDDSDFTYEWSMKGPANHSPAPGDGENDTLTGTGTVVVDAVAQGVGSLGDDYVEADDDDVLGEDEGNKTATVTLTATILDTDGSEDCFFLVEMVPGLAIAGADTVYVDGTMYYKVPADSVAADGTATANVEITVERNGIERLNDTDYDTENEDGSTSYELSYGAMTQENLDRQGGRETPESNTPGGELSYDNNVSFDTSGKLEIKVSYVNGAVTVAEMQGTYEDDAESGVIAVNVTLDGNDVIDSFTVTCDPEAGEIVYVGADGTRYSADAEPNFDDCFGEGNWTYKDGKLTLNGPDKALFDGGKLVLSTEDNYSGDDTDISWTATIRDPLSGDTQTFTGGQKVVIDAVAQAPDVVSVDLVSATGNEAALSGGEASIAMTLAFEDTEGETHYAVLANEGEWTCDSVVITLPDGTTQTVTPKLVYDNNGDSYYGVEIEDAWLDEKGSVKVEFQVTAPTAETDTTYYLKGGGISVEDFNQPDGELALDNNWAESIKEYPVTIGVADAAEVTGSSESIDEVQGDTPQGDSLIKLEFATDADSNDEVSGLVLTMPTDNQGRAMGSFWYDGVEYNGTLTITDFDPDKGPFFEPNEYWSGSKDIAFTATVKDSLSGDSGDENAFSGKVTVTVNPVHTTPEDVEATGPAFTNGDTAADGGAEVVITVEAAFPDSDGSEGHYVLIEAKDGWTGDYGTYTDPDTGATYWKVPASSTGTTNVTLQAPGGVDDEYTFKTGALAVENGLAGGAFEEGEDVTISVGDVQTTAEAGEVSFGTGSEDPTDNAGRAQLTLEVDAETLEANGETLEGIALKVPAGCKVFDADGNEVKPVNGVITLDVAEAEAGNYYFQAGPNQSGDNFRVDISYTVKDTASGKTVTTTETEYVSIASDTDIPVIGQSSVGSPREGVNHTAAVDVTLQATFSDTDGSENHFFLVKVPTGITQPDGWTQLDANDAIFLAMIEKGEAREGDIYYLSPNLGNTDTSMKVTFNVGADYEGGDITYVAGSREKTGDVDYEFDSGTVALDTVDVGGFNYSPTVVRGNNDGMTDALRDPDEPVTGQLVLDDADGDTVTVTGASCNGTNATPVQGGQYDGWLAVQGESGILYINADGAFEYVLDEGADPRTAADERFTVTIDDGYGAADSTNSSTITISFDTPNNAPIALGDLTQSVGGGNEGTTPVRITGSMELTDADAAKGDVITITRVGTQTTMQTEGDRSFFEVAGQFGVLRVFTDGSYEYMLANEHATGQERFEVAFEDPYGAEYGGTGKGTIVIDVKPVNHAPELTIDSKEFTEDSGSYILGRITFGDADLDTQNDALTLTVTVGDKTYAIPTDGWSGSIETEYGYLNVHGSGEYTYSPKDQNAAPGLNVWDGVTVTVTDKNGLSDSADLNIKLGDPAEPANAAIHAGSDTDAIYGDGGNDTFIWNMENFGGNDAINDFTFEGDRISFDGLDLFPDMEASDLANLFAETNTPRSFLYTAENDTSIEATFFNNTTLELSVSRGGENQVITVHADAFYEAGQNLTTDMANEILQQIIKEYGS